MSNKYQSTKKQVCRSCGETKMRLEMFRTKETKEWFCRSHITNKPKVYMEADGGSGCVSCGHYCLHY